MPGEDTYFITASTARRRPLLQSERMARLFIDVLEHYRLQGKYALHAYVVMPDHFHVLLTPASDQTVERVAQLIKGGFSYRARKELGFQGELWQPSYYDRRVRDAQEFQHIRDYILLNPVRRRLARSHEEFPFCSAAHLDAAPQRLKPLTRTA